VSRKTRTLFHKIFSKKRLVIISDEEIVSVPFGPQVQASIVILATVTLVWLSYTSGRYFAYQDILSAKDREITHTNLTNETLQYQVTDLQKNLVRLNSYFEQVKKYDQLRPTLKTDKDGKAVREDSGTEESNVNDEMAILDEGVKEVLIDIHAKIRERIQTLETVIAMTGVGMSHFIKEDPDLKKSAARSAATAANLKSLGQGGPFEPENGKVGGTAGLFDPVLLEQSLDGNLEYLQHLEDIVHQMPLSKPMKGYTVSSGFGHRLDPIRKIYATHSGIDFVGKFKSRVLATAPGVVVLAEMNGAYGMCVEIDHGNGLRTRYGHMSKILVHEGQKLGRGQVVGLQGNTGRSTGSHLHYEVRYDGVAVDPETFLKAGEYVF
jgi:murein DD-endopeptidase MepM/ murein hydrolase activator NlpD